MYNIHTLKLVMNCHAFVPLKWKPNHLLLFLRTFKILGTPPKMQTLLEETKVSAKVSRLKMLSFKLGVPKKN